MKLVPTVLALALVPLLPAAPAAAEETPAGEQMRASECRAWVDATYQLESLIEHLDLDVGTAYETLVACVERDASLMKPVIPVGWCDNILKIHCSGLDLLTVIGEASIDRCAEFLEASLGIEAGQHRAWRTCGQDVVFDRYSLEGELSEEPACRAALLESCGTRIEEDEPLGETDSSTSAFAECCFADALEPERGEDGPCAMIDAGFSRGPCRDRPVCVNRLSGEWLSCRK